VTGTISRSSRAGSKRWLDPTVEWPPDEFPPVCLAGREPDCAGYPPISCANFGPSWYLGRKVASKEKTISHLCSHANREPLARTESGGPSGSHKEVEDQQSDEMAARCISYCGKQMGLLVATDSEEEAQREAQAVCMELGDLAKLLSVMKLVIQ
jgi:hypothetical protein